MGKDEAEAIGAKMDVKAEALLLLMGEAVSGARRKAGDVRAAGVGLLC